MSVNSDDEFLEGLDFFGEVVDKVPDDGWGRPSACDGWTVLDVLGHVGSVVTFGTALMQGEQPSWDGAPGAPGDAVEGEPKAWWAALAGPARSAVAGADLDAVLDSPTGRRSIREGLSFPTVDCFVHAWDMALPFDLRVVIPEHMIAFAHQTLDKIPEDQLRSERVFGPPASAGSDASESDRFLAWTGRDPQGAPGSCD